MKILSDKLKEAANRLDRVIKTMSKRDLDKVSKSFGRDLRLQTLTLTLKKLRGQE